MASWVPLWQWPGDFLDPVDQYGQLFRPQPPLSIHIMGRQLDCCKQLQASMLIALLFHKHTVDLMALKFDMEPLSCRYASLYALGKSGLLTVTQQQTLTIPQLDAIFHLIGPTSGMVIVSKGSTNHFNPGLLTVTFSRPQNLSHVQTFHLLSLIEESRESSHLT